MDVGGKVVSALRWSAASRLAGSALSWVMTILVIRLLSPSDYGVLAMAVILPSALYLLNDLGLDVVLVQQQDADERLRRQVFGIVIVANLLCAGVLVVGAPLIAQFFREPAIVPVMHVLSLQFLLFIFDTLPRAKLEQRLDFRSQSVISVIATWLGGLATLILAATGFGVWSLVWGRLVSTATTTVALNVVAPMLYWPIFSLRAARRSLRFGAIVTMERTAWQLFTDADKVIGGRLWNDATLGLYTVAQDLATMPMHKTGGLIGAIGLPAFSGVQDRMEEVRFYLLKATRIISVLAFPMFIGLALTASEAVALLLGPAWMGAAPILQILALIMPLRMVATLLSPVLWGIARPGISATNVMIAAVVIPCACLIGARWGPVGMASAWLAAYPIVFILMLHRAGGPLGLTLRDFWGAIRWPAAASLIMVAAVEGTRWLLPSSGGVVVTLLIVASVGALVYVGALLIFDRPSIREALLLAAGSGRRADDRPLGLLDRAQPEGARADRANERPVLLELHRLRAVPVEYASAALVRGVVEQARQEVDGHEVLSGLLPGLGDLGRAHRDVLEAVDLALGPQPVAVSLELRLHLRREVARDAPEIPGRPRALDLEEDVRGGLREGAGIEAGIHLTEMPDAPLQIGRARRGLHRGGAAGGPCPVAG
jgi:teichuronic acid exporter